MLGNKFLIFTLLFCALRLAPCANSFAREEFVYDAKGKRNPFIPLVTSDGRLLKLESQDTVTSLSLKGIIYDKNGPSYAIINDEIVKIGDKIGDYQVLRIEDKRITLIKDRELLEMVIEKEEW